MTSILRSRNRVALAAVAGSLLAAAGCGKEPGQDNDPGELRDAARIEGAPMCPWRNPAADVSAWFTNANRSDAEIQILSGLRPEMTKKLGRTPTADENALHIHRIWRDTDLLGEVAVRRVKGESGAVELVVAFGPDGLIRGVRVQRSRETAAVSAALDEAWLSGFRGKSGADPLLPGTDLPSVPAYAATTAAAMAEGVRSLLVLHDLAASPGAVKRPAPEANAGHFH